MGCLVCVGIAYQWFPEQQEFDAVFAEVDYWLDPDDEDMCAQKHPTARDVHSASVGVKTSSRKACACD